MLIPLYLIVSKFNPIRLGRRNVLRDESHVPSPTYIVSDEYVLLPAGDSWGEGDMVSVAVVEQARRADRSVVFLSEQVEK